MMVGGLMVLDLVEWKAVQVAKSVIDFSAVSDFVVCGEAGDALTMLQGSIDKTRVGGLAVVWWGQPDLPKWGRVRWADCLIGIHYPDALAMWHLGLEGAYGRLAGKDLGNGLSVNVFGRGLRHAAYKDTGLRLVGQGY